MISSVSQMGLGQTGASIYNQTTNQVYMFQLGTYFRQKYMLSAPALKLYG